MAKPGLKEMYDFGKIARIGKKIFLDPSQIPWDRIINGSVVSRGNKRKKFYAVGPNTFRGYHRVDKSQPGASIVFRSFFTTNKRLIIDKLRNVQRREQLHDLEKELAFRIKKQLSNIKPEVLKSFNKIRKPIDLYLDHLIAMANECADFRERLVPLLFLPLDSEMIASPSIFCESDLRKYGLTTRSTYASITKEPIYLDLQETVLARSRSISSQINQPFHPVYFELIWGDRYQKTGSNLFELNT